MFTDPSTWPAANSSAVLLTVPVTECNSMKPKVNLKTLRQKTNKWNERFKNTISEQTTYPPVKAIPRVACTNFTLRKIPGIHEERPRNPLCLLFIIYRNYYWASRDPKSLNQNPKSRKFGTHNLSHILQMILQMILLGLQAVNSSTEDFLVVGFSELYSR
jgi:hypothetical protein